MAFLSLKMVGPPPLFSGTNNKDSRIKRPTELRTHLQVRSEKVVEQQPQCPKSITISRRDAMLSAVPLAAVTLFSADSAEARVWNPDIKRKILEKLQLLREKAGLSKPKSEDKKAAEEKQKSPSAEEKHKSPSADDKHKSPSAEEKHKSPSAEDKHKSPSAEEKHKSPSAEDKHKSPSPHPPATLPKEKMPKPPKKETPPLPVPQNGTQKGPAVEATHPK